MFNILMLILKFDINPIDKSQFNKKDFFQLHILLLILTYDIQLYTYIIYKLF